MSNVRHAGDYREPHYIILHEEKDTVEGPDNVGLTRKPEQIYGLILEEEEEKLKK